MASVRHTHYILGSVVGPHPYPMMVRDFQLVIGKEVKKQILEKETDCPIILLPVLAAVVIRWDYSILLLKIKR